jgi:hypothetical protein
MEHMMTVEQSPRGLVILAETSLLLAAASALWIMGDLLAGHRQRMWIMNAVWPVTALWAGPMAVYAYYRVGRLSTHRRVREAQERGEEPPGKNKPFWQVAGLAATHCGSGCTLGDICAEWIAWAAALTLFGYMTFAAWFLDYGLAFTFGIAFQYFTIAPMRGLGVREGIKAALKADTLSLTVWQVGMYGWMAIVTFALFGHELAKPNPVFGLMMQIAMAFGFLTSLPVNWWLLKKGIKEKM